MQAQLVYAKTLPTAWGRFLSPNAAKEAPEASAGPLRVDINAAKKEVDDPTKHSHLLLAERGWRVASEATINTRRVKRSLRAPGCSQRSLAQGATSARRRRGPADAQTPPARPQHHTVRQ